MSTTIAVVLSLCFAISCLGVALAKKAGPMENTDGRGKYDKDDNFIKDENVNSITGVLFAGVAVMCLVGIIVTYLCS